MKKRIFILGAFGYNNNQLDGQTIKTRNVYDLIKCKFDGFVSYIDTLDIRRKPWLVFSLLWRMMSCNKLVLIPCTNNLTIIFPIAYYFSVLFKFDIIHICIGGWQVEYFLGSKEIMETIGDSCKPRWTPHYYHMKLNKKIRVIMPEMKTEIEELKKNRF